MQKTTSSRHQNKIETLRSEFPVRPTQRQDGRFRRHVKSHEAIVQNEFWYGDDAPTLGEQFTVEETAERKNVLVKILRRVRKRVAKKGNRDLARAYNKVLKKLKRCRPTMPSTSQRSSVRGFRPNSAASSSLVKNSERIPCTGHCFC
jgi:hypothetical protein